LTEDPIDACLAGHISPEIALARLLLGGHTAASIATALAAQRPTPDTSAYKTLAAHLAIRAPALDRLAAEIIATVADHSALGPDGIARIARFFDHAVSHSPEASVALYSLGDPAILAAATEEITTWLAAYTPVTGDILDLGCGIGRLATALAPAARSYLGLDVSPRMIAEARRRTAHLPRTHVLHTQGHALATPRAAFDLVLAIDSFPYILEAGAAPAHLAAIATALRPGGALAILNLSYHRTLATDQADIAAWSTQHHLTPTINGTHPFTLWDAPAFLLTKP